MKPYNIRTVLFLGGILLMALGFQFFQLNSVESFATEESSAADNAATMENIKAGGALFNGLPSESKTEFLAEVKSGIPNMMDETTLSGRKKDVFQNAAESGIDMTISQIKKMSR
jgi:hypothetical protein